MNKRFLDFYMKIANECANMSYANRLKVGCVIVNDRRIISMGWNGTPSGWSNQCEDENNNTYNYVSHAEENALMKLCKTSDSSENSIMFITHSPCPNCAKLIFNAGINTVYYNELYRSDDGLKYLQELGVTTTLYNG